MPPIPVTRRRMIGGSVAVVAIGAVPAGATAQRQRGDVPYVPTPPEVVEGMLDMAGLQSGERLIDLGSGDGRIPIAAARRGAQALGVEINPTLVARARSQAELVGQQDRARFVRDDLFAVSLRDADVVTLYLLPAINERLRPKLLTEMRAGARIVSHAFDMGEWIADEHRRIAEKNVYRWTVPAVAGGRWQLRMADGRSASLDIEQRYQRVSGTIDGAALSAVTLDGTRLRFELPAGAGEGRYFGIVGDAAIEPDPEAPAGAALQWRAVRPD